MGKTTTLIKQNKTMKKTLLYSMAAMASLVFASCSGDYDDWASPQTNAQEDATAKYGVSFSAGSEANVVLPDADGTVHLVTASSTNSDVSGFTLKSLTINGETVDGTMDGNDICVSATDLEKLIESQNDSRAATARAIEVKANVSVNTSSGDALITDVEADISGTVTPQPTPELDTKGYYILGDFTGVGWNLPTPLWMTDNNDGTYSAHVVTTGTGDNWYKFYEGSDYSSTDWDTVNAGQMGCETNGDGSRHNFLVYTDDPLYTDGVQTPVINGAGEWDITLDMNNLTYTVKPSESKYYIIGNPQGWSSTDKSCMLYGKGDNIYTYTTHFTNQWDLKVANEKSFEDQEHFWGLLWGGVNGSTAASGDLIYADGNSDNAGAIGPSESGGWYTFTIDMNNNKYTWTAIDTPTTEYTSWSLIGDFNSWGGDVDMTQLAKAPHNWYVRATIPSTGGLKFRANHGWDVNYGTTDADKDTAIGDTYHLDSQAGGQNITVPAGTYDFYLNDITGEFNIVPVE